MSTRHVERDGSHWIDAARVGLVVAAGLTVAFKFLTGLSMLPLLLVAVLIFSVAAALRLRMVRSGQVIPPASRR
jgi:hypothetical protein